MRKLLDDINSVIFLVSMYVTLHPVYVVAVAGVVVGILIAVACC